MSEKQSGKSAATLRAEAYKAKLRQEGQAENDTTKTDAAAILDIIGRGVKKTN